jgi:hypothetical protein
MLRIALGLVAAALLAPGRAPACQEAPACGDHGTSVNFVETPAEAARLAKAQQKLVFVLHVSGHFEDPRFT